MSIQIQRILSWAIVLWICKVFLFSLPYKFSRHPDTQHIFGTIGSWMSKLMGAGIGDFFTQYGAYIVGGFELLTSIVLLAPAALWCVAKLRGSSSAGLRRRWHMPGGLMAAAVMAGAVFFHLFTPLGIEVMQDGESDGGSLFYSAVSILVLGIVLFFINSSNRRQE